MTDDVTLTQVLTKLALPTASFVGGLFSRHLVDWWKYITARAKYEDFRKTYPESVVIKLDTAIPSFEVDGNSIVPTEEKFIISALPLPELLQHNEHKAKYHSEPPFKFECDNFFGSKDIAHLSDITGIPDIAQRVEKSRKTVSTAFSQKGDGRFFNSKKLGVRNFNFDRAGDDERSRLDIRAFETDYFTHCVMQATIKDYLKDNPKIISEIRKNKEILNDRYYPFLTSIGLNVFLFTDLKRVLAFSRRSLSASGGNSGGGKLHVAMNEGLSFTDFQFQQRGDGQVTALNCFRRGMREELGFNEYEQKIGSLNIFDAFIVTESFQFGLFAWTSYNGHFPELVHLRAQDKEMESLELVEVRFDSRSIGERIKNEEFVPYTRVGLEGLCRIHGVNTYDTDVRGYSFHFTWLRLAFESAFKKRKY
jgi:hypothetical protein